MALALGAATLTVPLVIASGAEAARVQPRTSSPTSTLAVIKTVGVGNVVLSGAVIAVNDVDDTVYVTNGGSNTVSVINGRTGQNTNSDITVDTGPFSVGVNQLDDTVYVTNPNVAQISVINGPTNTRDDSVIVGNSSYGVAVHDADDTVYIGGLNSLWFINGRADTLVATIAGLADFAYAVAVNQVDDTVYVALQNNDRLMVVNGRTNSWDDTITVGDAPWAVAVDQDDDTVYVVNAGSNNVSIINGRTRTVSSTSGVGALPTGIAIDQADDTVYVTNHNDNNVSVINGRTGQVTDDTVTIGSSSAPAGIAVDNSGPNAGLVYVANAASDNVTVIGRVTPSLTTTSGAEGDTATITLDVPQVDYEVDNSTINSVTFGTTVLPSGDLTPGAGDTWEFTVPAGTGTVPVTVDLKGASASVSAGDFTYSSTPTPTPPTPASAPRDVTATAGNASATVTWAAPTSAGSYPITTYRATSSPGGRICLVAAPALACDVTGLTNGTAYTFTVKALTGAGWGATSNPSNAVTPQPTTTPTIVITGQRDPGSGARQVRVTGTSTGLEGRSIKPFYRYAGQDSFTAGNNVRLASSTGDFKWKRRTAKRTFIYFTAEGVQSNEIVIAKLS